MEIARPTIRSRSSQLRHLSRGRMFRHHRMMLPHISLKNLHRPTALSRFPRLSRYGNILLDGRASGIGIWFRLGWVLGLGWSITACAGLSVNDVAHQTLSSLELLSVQTSDADPVAIDSSDRSGVHFSLNASSQVLPAMQLGISFDSSTLHLAKNRAGSISLL